MIEKTKLTQQQRRVYDFISKNPAATYQEIADHLDRSIGLVQAIVKSLTKKGWLGEGKEPAQWRIL